MSADTARRSSATSCCAPNRYSPKMTSVPVWVWFSSLVFAAGGGCLWWRVVAQTTEAGSGIRRVGNVFFVLVALAPPVALLGQFLMPMTFQRVVGWPAWIGYGFVIFAGSIAVLLEPIRAVRWLRRRRAEKLSAATVSVADGRGRQQIGSTGYGLKGDPPNGVGSVLMSRRFVVERVMGGGILAAGAAVTGISLVGALGEPRVRQRSIAIRSLPDEAVGTRIALISDLHVGSLTRREECRRVVELVNAQNPDIICLAGDFSDGAVVDLRADLAPLADLRSKSGTFFVTGNHEFYFDVAGWLQFLPTIGVRVLANESVQVRGMLLAGTHDIQGEPAGMGPDVRLALQDRVDGQPAILLSHNPAVLDDAIEQNIDLLLAGHTHGGQFLPGVWIVGATTRTLSGYYSFGDTQVFVTNGCRFWGPPARLGAPMDISVLDLVRAANASESVGAGT